jgi:hypothetical protein
MYTEQYIIKCDCLWVDAVKFYASNPSNKYALGSAERRAACDECKRGGSVVTDDDEPRGVCVWTFNSRGGGNADKESRYTILPIE